MSTTTEHAAPPVAELPYASPAIERSSVGDEAWENYRPIPIFAVVSLLVSIAGLVAFFDSFMLSIGVFTLVMAVMAWFSVRKNRDVVRGTAVAGVALALGLVNTLGAGAYHVYDYATEVPEGYVRLSYAKLQPDERDPVAWDLKIQQLDGTKVFIEGYALAGNQQKGIKTFILCRDKGDCCFGGNPKISERVLIQLTDPVGIDYTDREQKFIGVFRNKKLSNAVDVSNGGDVWYVLEGASKR
ncbi:MAG: hypothetical protein QM811_13840 [Pirellulales bacterium]